MEDSTTTSLRGVMASLREKYRSTFVSGAGTSSPAKEIPSEAPAAPPWPLGVARAVPSGSDPQILAQVVQAAQRGQWPILLAGPSGVGKSCLSCLVASRIPHWRFAPASELVGQVVQARVSDTKSVLVRTMSGNEVERNETEILRWVESASILVLDDVGVRPMTEVQSDILLRVLDLRMGRPLIATTNCTALTLPQMVGERCASRLRAGSQFRMGGDDRRVSRGGAR